LYQLQHAVSIAVSQDQALHSNNGPPADIMMKLSWPGNQGPQLMQCMLLCMLLLPYMSHAAAAAASCGCRCVQFAGLLAPAWLLRSLMAAMFNLAHATSGVAATLIPSKCEVLCTWLEASPRYLLPV
jgi:hypothetical protein